MIKEWSDNISWVVKDEQTGTAKQVALEPNINDTFKLFLKPFSYLFNAEYITPEMKSQYRQEAIDSGYLVEPGEAVTVQQTKPPTTGTYT